MLRRSNAYKGEAEMTVGELQFRIQSEESYLEDDPDEREEQLKTIQRLKRLKKKKLALLFPGGS